MDLQRFVQEVADFPKEGILFRDISPLLRDSNAWQYALNQLEVFAKSVKPDLIVGIESRGFIVGSALSSLTKIGFIPVRKSGKLPGHTHFVEYDLEYGKDRLEIQKNVIQPNSRIVVVDDLLATGGTAKATTELVSLAGGKIVGYCFIVELNELNGRNQLAKLVPIKSLVTYD